MRRFKTLICFLFLLGSLSLNDGFVVWLSLVSEVLFVDLVVRVVPVYTGGGGCGVSCWLWTGGLWSTPSCGPSLCSRPQQDSSRESVKDIFL